MREGRYTRVTAYAFAPMREPGCDDDDEMPDQDNARGQDSNEADDWFGDDLTF
jgi:hypothetical protein